MTAPLDTKQLATLKARAALVGLALHSFEDDRGRQVFLIEKYGLTKTVESPEAVSDFIVRVGGPAA